MQNIKDNFAVVFDMDGVLIDSTGYIWASFNKLLGPLGVHFDEAAIRKYMGLSLQDVVALWKKDLGIDVGDLSDFAKKCYAMQEELGLMAEVADENLFRLLEGLKTKDVPMGVGTASFRVRTETILSGLGIRTFFNAVVTAQDVSEHKPNPQVFLEVASQLGVPPEKCIVIEDAGLGIEAAKRANMKAVGFLTKWNSKEELARADRIISSFQKLSFKELQSLFF